LLTAEPVASVPAARRCGEAGSGWCVARRIVSEVPGGELGFRFGSPLDSDGDGAADISAGARFALRGVHQDGMAAVWSGATGSRIHAWVGSARGGLYGHWVLPVPDLDGDGLADVVITAPNATVDGVIRGTVEARSPRSGELLWQHTGTPGQNLGWDLALAADHDDDGHRDVFVGAPGHQRGVVHLISGRTGARLRTFSPPDDEPTFGWYVASVADLDGDGRGDVVVGAHLAADAAGAAIGAAFVFSTASGEMLFRWRGRAPLSGFGEVVASLADADGDGVGEVAVAAPRTNDRSRLHPGEVTVYSGRTGTAMRRLTGRQAGELFGRMTVAAGDLDGDGVEDLAIGAPWHRGEAGARTGRVEFRSGRDGAVLGEIIGDTADAWFGWHIERAPDPGGTQRPALLIGSLRHPINGVAGVGVVDLYVLRQTDGVTARSGATPAATTSGTPATPPAPRAEGR
jgi:hypothetical protein